MTAQPAEAGVTVKALQDAWTDFCDANPDGLTSPEELPDHALMTCQQFVDYALSALHPTPAPQGMETAVAFQSRVQPWMMACFGSEISADRLERADRFIEEALELLQSVDYPRERILALVDYVYGRAKGELAQEVGGVMVTLAAFCLAHGVDMHEAGEIELARIWTKVDKIRAKQAAKPTGSALPIATPQPATSGVNAEMLAAFRELEAKAVGQKAYFNTRQHEFPSLEEVFDEDGNLTIPEYAIGSLVQGAEANGRYSEADWWLSTIRAAIAAAEAQPPAVGMLDPETLKARAAAVICEVGALCGWPGPDCKSTEAAEALFKAGLLSAAPKPGGGQ